MVRDVSEEPNFDPATDGASSVSVATAPIVHSPPPPPSSRASSRGASGSAAQGDVVGVLQIRWTNGQAALSEDDEVRFKYSLPLRYHQPQRATELS